MNTRFYPSLIISPSLVLLVGLYGVHVQSGEPTPLHVYAIPGQNGMGSEPWYVRDMLGWDGISVTEVKTPRSTPDFGQKECLEYMESACATHSQSQTPEIALIHATSQGTATALNYRGKKKNSPIKALILEATLASGNSAIYHTVKGSLLEVNLSFLTHLPLSYYWLPYAAKLFFIAYWPGGVQAIMSLDDIPTDLTIILAHSKHDRQLSYSDACALYYGLCLRGNHKVYFISKEGEQHFGILQHDGDVVRAILRKEGILKPSGEEEIDLTPYQPDPTPFKEHYTRLRAKEKKHRRIGNVLMAPWYLLKKLGG